jgi:hypothetical protein
MPYPIDVKQFQEMLEGRSYIMTDSKMYRIDALSEVPNIQADIRKFYERSLLELDTAFKRTYNDLQAQTDNKMLRAKSDGMKAGMHLQESLPEHWEIKKNIEGDNEDGHDSCFKVFFKGEIHPKNIKKGTEFAKLTPLKVNRYYIKDIILRVSYDMLMQSATASGFSPHLDQNDYSEYADVVSDNEAHVKWAMCMGDLGGKPLTKENLKALEKALEVINLDSAYLGLSTNETQVLFTKAKEDAKVKNVVWYEGGATHGE